jgi:REP element-mobilizing transposase RayT
MCRGDRREAIFRNDDDRLLMLETLAETCERAGFLVHSYVLMPNHYHLLLETPEPNLVAGMKWFQGTYTQRFNARNRLSGHLFQGRYKAIPVEAEDSSYFRVVSDYIHLNPARARMLEGSRPQLAGYRWSSYPAFVRGAALWPGLTRGRVFSALELPDEGRGSRTRFRAYLERRAAEVLRGELSEEEEEAWRDVRRGWYCGSDSFRDLLLDRMDRAVRGRRRESYISEGLRLHDEREAVEQLRIACRVLDMTLKEVRQRRQNDPEKQAVAWWVKSRTVVSDRWVCEQLMMGNRVNVSRAVGAFRDPEDAGRRRLQKRMYKCTD